MLTSTAVKISAFTLYNGEVTDILDSTKNKLRFRKETNHQHGSKNYGVEYSQLVGATKITIQSTNEIGVIIKMAQQAMQFNAETLGLEVNDYSQRCIKIVRAEIA